MSETWDSRIGECSNEQLSLLLSLAGEPEHPARALAPRADEEGLPEVLRGAMDANLPGADLEEILHSETPVSRIQEIKRTAKRRFASARDRSERGAATLLYHASVAAAYVRHGVVISSRPITSVSGLYDDLATALGSDPLGLLFRQAAERIAGPQDPVEGEPGAGR